MHLTNTVKIKGEATDLVVLISTIDGGSNPFVRFPETCVFWEGTYRNRYVKSSKVVRHHPEDEEQILAGHDYVRENIEQGNISPWADREEVTA